VVIDLIGYRKMGHNELDQPSFTQPLMYNIIKNKQPVRNMYRQ
jgi:2-oxoglutarate dehydrogenase E1 component